mgnify:CR=1 FL=1
MTGFEPATTRTPCVYATRLRHIPKTDCKNINFTDITSPIPEIKKEKTSLWKYRKSHRYNSQVYRTENKAEPRSICTR